jgi:hypothetical protein
LRGDTRTLARDWNLEANVPARLLPSLLEPYGPNRSVPSTTRNLDTDVRERITKEKPDTKVYAVHGDAMYQGRPRGNTGIFYDTRLYDDVADLVGVSSSVSSAVSQESGGVRAPEVAFLWTVSLETRWDEAAASSAPPTAAGPRIHVFTGNPAPPRDGLRNGRGERCRYRPAPAGRPGSAPRVDLGLLRNRLAVHYEYYGLHRPVPAQILPDGSALIRNQPSRNAATAWGSGAMRIVGSRRDAPIKCWPYTRISWETRAPGGPYVAVLTGVSFRGPAHETGASRTRCARAGALNRRRTRPPNERESHHRFLQPNLWGEFAFAAFRVRIVPGAVVDPLHRAAP